MAEGGASGTSGTSGKNTCPVPNLEEFQVYLELHFLLLMEQASTCVTVGKEPTPSLQTTTDDLNPSQLYESTRMSL